MTGSIDAGAKVPRIEDELNAEEMFEYRKKQDDIVKRKLAVPPLCFEANGMEMMYCYPDSKHELAGWILYRHPDGQWATLRKATDEDTRRMSQVVSRCFHANANN